MAGGWSRCYRDVMSRLRELTALIRSIPLPDATRFEPRSSSALADMLEAEHDPRALAQLVWETHSRFHQDPAWAPWRVAEAPGSLVHRLAHEVEAETAQLNPLPPTL